VDISVQYTRSVLITTTVKILAIPIGIASSIITARYLGPSGRGILILLITLQGLAIQFGTFGFNASITYFISRDKMLTSRIISNALFIAIVVGSVLALVFFLMGKYLPQLVLGEVDPIYLNIFLLSLPFAFLQQFLQNVFIAQERIMEFNVLDLLTRLLQVFIFSLVLIVLRASIFEAVLSLTGVTIVSGVIYAIRSTQNISFQYSFDSVLFRHMFRYGVRTYVASIVMFLVFRVNVFFINTYLGEYDSGLYSIVLQISDLVYLLPVIMGMLLFPKVSANHSDTGLLTAKVFRFSLYGMSIVCVGLMFIGRMIIVVLFGGDFEPAVEPLIFLLPGIVTLSLVTILNNDLAGRGLPIIVIIAPFVGLIITIIINLVFISAWGLVASSLASSLAFSSMLVLLLRDFLNRVSIPWRDLFLLKRTDFSFFRFPK
jgi:O-antigen/teichoic acid export membrane protein